MTDIPEIKTNDYGELSVQLATTGEVLGSDTDGNPVRQNFTEEAFQKIADDVNESGEDIPVDKDHASMRPGLNRDTESMGWISRLWANAKGLFGWLKFTRKGRELVEDRAYRFLSPSFDLDDNGSPVQLINAAFTNQPACSGNRPILNNVPNHEDILNMNIDELKALIKSTVQEMKEQTTMNAAPAETKTDEDNSEVACNAAPKEKTDEACDQCGDVEKTETVNEETTTEETTEETVEEASKEADETPDEEDSEEKKIKTGNEDGVVKLSALNSKPTTMLQSVSGGRPPWEGLHGQKFFDELQKHPEWKNWSKEA